MWCGLAGAAVSQQAERGRLSSAAAPTPLLPTFCTFALGLIQHFLAFFCIASTIPTNGVGKNALRVDICGSIYRIKSNFRRVGPGQGTKDILGESKSLWTKKYYEAMSSKWKYCCESDSTVAGGGLACGVPGCAVHRRLTASTNYKLPKHCTPPSQVHCGHYRLCWAACSVDGRAMGGGKGQVA